MSPVADSTVDTRLRIMEATTRLCAEHGIQATSLRAITAEAGVNLAAVNYHYGSKDNLIAEVLIELVRPINLGRYALLDAYEKEAAPGAICIEKVLEALYRPCFEHFGRDDESRSKLKLLGRSLHETGEFTQILAEREWQPLVGRFHGAMRQALPGTDDEILLWHFHFSIGAMIHAASQYQMFCSLCSGIEKLDYDSEVIIGMLVRHNAAGFRSSLQPK